MKKTDLAPATCPEPHVLRSHEVVYLRALPADVRAELAAMDRLYETVMFAVGEHGFVIDAELSKFTVRTLVVTFAKATKTFRAIELAGTAGLRGEAAALSRTLFELVAVVRFILSHENPTGAAATVWAYYFEQGEKMVRSWDSSPTLRGTAAPDLLARHAQAWARVREQVPGGVDYTKHWSGRPGGIAEVCDALNLGDWYRTLFRHTSVNVHGLDLIDHLDIDEAGEWVIDFEPNASGLRPTLRWASILFWSIATDVLDGIGSPIDLSHVKPDDNVPPPSAESPTGTAATPKSADPA